VTFVIKKDNSLLARHDSIFGFLLDHCYNLLKIIIPTGDVAPDPGAGQTLLGELDPGEQAFSRQCMEEAVDKAMQNEELWRRSQEKDEAMFDSVINHMAGIDDRTWPQGLGSKMTPEVEKELIAMGNEVKARAIKTFEKK